MKIKEFYKKYEEEIFWYFAGMVTVFGFYTIGTFIDLIILK